MSRQNQEVDEKLKISVMDIIFNERPGTPTDWEDYMSGNSEGFTPCEQYGLDSIQDVQGVMESKYNEFEFVYMTLPPRIPTDTFVGTFLPVSKTHPLYHNVESDEERMVSVEDWESEKEHISEKECEHIEALINHGLTDIVLSRAD